MEFLAEISKPEYQANLPEVHYLRADQQSGLRHLGKIDEDRGTDALPSHPDNAAMQLPIDIEWYGEVGGHCSGEVPRNAD